jgi:hypothetical protein
MNCRVYFLEWNKVFNYLTSKYILYWFFLWEKSGLIERDSEYWGFILKVNWLKVTKGSPLLTIHNALRFMAKFKHTGSNYIKTSHMDDCLDEMCVY